MSNAFTKPILDVIGRLNTAATTAASTGAEKMIAMIRTIHDGIGFSINSTTTDNLQGKIGTDTEMADASLYDMLKYYTLHADGGSHKYPDSVVQESIFAYIMSDAADPIITSFDNTRDSLPALGKDVDAIIATLGVVGAGLTVLATAAELAKVPKSDSTVTWNATALQSIQDEGEDALEGENLNYLVKDNDGGTTYPTKVADNSVMGIVLTSDSGGDISDFNNAKHSQQAIGDDTDTIIANQKLPIYTRTRMCADSARLASLAFSNVAADKDFPSVAVESGFLPTGATIKAVYPVLRWDKFWESSGAWNAINGANKGIYVKASGSAWADSIAAMLFKDNDWTLSPYAELAGSFELVGTTDIKSVVTSDNKTFNFRSEQTNRTAGIVVDGASLTIYGVQMGLKFEYTLS